MRALLLLVALLGLVVLASAGPLAVDREWYTSQTLPEGDLFSDFKLDPDNMRVEAMSKFLSESPAPAVLPLSGDEDECCKCARGVGEHVLESILDSVDKACQNVTCPIIKQRCEWIGKNKEEFTGFVVARTHPVLDGYLYCMGNGTCKHPSSLDSSAAFTSPVPEALLAQLSAAAGFVRQGLGESFQYALAAAGGAESADAEEVASAAALTSEVEARAAMHGDMHLRVSLAPSAAAAESSSADGLSLEIEGGGDAEELGSRRRCHKCLAHGVRWVMKRAVRHLKQQCKRTKCEKFKKFCAWAKEHKAFVRGAIYAYVRPYKYATGWCFGKEMCGHRKAWDHVRSFKFTMIGASAATTPRLMPVGHLAELVRKDKSKKRQKYY